MQSVCFLSLLLFHLSHLMNVALSLNLKVIHWIYQMNEGELI